MYVCIYLFIYVCACGKESMHSRSYKYLSPVQCMEETYPCNSRYTPIFRTIQIPYFDYFAYVLNVVKKKRVVSKANQLGIGNYSTRPYWTMLNQGSWLCSSSCESLQSRKASPHFLSDIAAAETLARFANLKAKKNMLRCIPQGKKHATASRAAMWNMWNHVTSNG